MMPAADSNCETDENPFSGLTLSAADIPNTSWFRGRSPKRIMNAVASITDGHFEDGGFFGSAAVSGTWGGHAIEVELDGDSDHQWFTMQGCLMSPGNEHFPTCELREAGFLDILIRKVFNTQDVEIGHSQFDKRYLIKGHPEDAVRELFSPADIQMLIELQPGIRMSVERRSVRLVGPSVHDANLLLTMFELTYELLERLTEQRA